MGKEKTDLGKEKETIDLDKISPTGLTLTQTRAQTQTQAQTQKQTQAQTHTVESPLYSFKSQEESDLFHKITHQLRCTVCQNQSVADSESKMAAILRQEVYTQIIKNADEEQILEEMKARYGDYIVYNPPLNLETVLLWIGPFMVLAFGIFMFSKMLKKG